jgi:hypothetical protein
MDSMHARGHELTVGELRKFLEGKPDAFKVFFFVKDDCWDGADRVEAAVMDEGRDSIRNMEQVKEDFDEAMEEYEEGIASGHLEAEKPGPPGPNCIVFTGNRN